MSVKYPIDIVNHKFYETVDVQVRFNDIDIFEHVNNAVIQSYFDLGRVTYLERIYGKDFYRHDQVLIIASNKTDFHEPVLMDDELEVRTSIYEIGVKSLKMIQVIYDRRSHRIKTVCDSVMVAVQRSTGTSIELPQQWRDAIEMFEKMAH